jgi:hypothetical protein
LLSPFRRSLLPPRLETTLKTETTSSSITLITMYRSTRRRIPEDMILDQYHCQHVKSRKRILIVVTVLQSEYT